MWVLGIELRISGWASQPLSHLSSIGQVLIRKEAFDLVGLPRTMWHSSGRRLGDRLPRSGREKEAPLGKGSPLFAQAQRSCLDMVDFELKYQVWRCNTQACLQPDLMKAFSQLMTSLMTLTCSNWHKTSQYIDLYWLVFCVNLPQTGLSQRKQLQLQFCLFQLKF